MTSVTIIGVGRVGGAIALALPANDYKVDYLFVRKPGETSELIARSIGCRISHEANYEEIQSEVVLIASQDGEIAAIDRELASKIRNKPVVLHTSGSLSSSILAECSAAKLETGSVHPLVSISNPEFGPERFPGAFFCVEGSEVAVRIGTTLAASLGGRAFSIPTDRKILYHAAAVTACGHFVALIDTATEMMSMCGLSPEFSKDILMPLVASTAANLESQTAGEALTGTFARADIETFSRHVTALNEHASQDMLELYLILGERSLELAASMGVNPDRVEKLRTKVAIAKSKLK